MEASVLSGRNGAASVAASRLGAGGYGRVRVQSRREQIPILPMAGAQSIRAFSAVSPRRMADVEEKFDPSAIERESDEVDVCIVGGGMSSL